MRIQRLKLKNFIGIDHGVGLSEIEINFDKNDNIILLKGANGSGKSTLLSQLHPFKQSFDERRYIILPGKEGLKEITIINGADVYEITHIYTPKKDGKHTTSSFIQKNGKELNDSGLDSTFEAVIYDEFGITPDYFQIGKIGSNTKLFTDKSVGERKSFICTFLNMEELTVKYKIIEAKVKAMKKDLTLVQSNINKYENLDTINITINELENYLRNADKELKQLYQANGILSGKINKIIEDKKQYNKADLEYELLQIDQKLDTYKDAISKIRSEFGDGLNAEKLMQILQEKMAQKAQVTEVSINAKINKESREGLKNRLSMDIERLTDEISGLKSDIDIVELQKNIDDIKAKILAINIPESVKEYLDLPDIKYSIDLISRLASIVQSKLSNIYAYPFIKPENVLNNSIINIISDYSGKNNTRKAEALSEEARLSAQIEYINVNAEKTAELLEMRPKTCINDACPFIRNAINDRNESLRLNELQEALKSVKDTIKKADDLEEKINLLLIDQNEFYRAYEAVKDNPLFLKWNILCPIETAHNNAQAYFNTFISFKNELLDALENNEMLKHLQTQLESFEKTFEFENQKIQLINNKYDKELKEKQAEYEVVSKEYAEYSADYLSAFEEVNQLTEIITNLNQSIEAVSEKRVLDDRRKEVVTSLNTLAQLDADYANTNATLAANNSSIAEYEAIIATKKQDLDAYKIKLSTVAELTKTLDAINNEYTPMMQIYEALSPSKGIPLVLMQVYLNATESVTNELLKIAFNDKFYIKFITNEKEFFIQVVVEDGSVKEDVKYVSQGEKSIIETSLALALISQMMTEYNILTIDEIDGPLDKDNRKQFVEILRSQMIRLGSEQFFIISHNDEFDDDGIATVNFAKGSVTYNPAH